jgi:predicted permease
MMMRVMSTVNRLRGFLRARHLERDLREEIEFHLEAKVRELVAGGMAEAEARLAARRAFGSMSLAVEDGRAAWRYALLDSIVQDVRYGVRALRRTPVFTTAVVLTLALGIGANTAIFTLVDRVMLRSLAVQDPGSLVAFGSEPLVGLRRSDEPADRSNVLFSYPLFLDLQRNADIYSGLAAASSFPVTAYLGEGAGSPGQRLEQADALLVSGNLFHVLGVRVPLGRPLTPGDDSPGASYPAVVLSHALWTRRYGSDPGVLGRRLRANGTDYTIVGVAAPGFRGLSVGTDIDLWVPMAMQARLMREESFLEERNAMWLRIIGRLGPGVGIGLAEARTNELFRQVRTEEAGADASVQTRAAIARLSIDVVPFGRGFSNMRSRWGRPLLTLMGIVGLVLLVACANVGNLLLARGSSRQRELSMRFALGAGRRRLARQLLTESVMLSLLGGATGLLVAHWTIRFLLGILSAGSAAALDATLDGPVLLFTAVVTLLAALLFGLVPAVRASRVDISIALRKASASVAAGHGFGLRRALVVFQVAISLCLLVGAGLLLRSLGNLRGQDFGFRTKGVLTVDVDPQGGGIDSRQWPQLYPALLERLRAIPGVSDASMSLYGVLGRARRVRQVAVDGYEARPDEDMLVQELFVTPDYFDTLGAPVTTGRTFDNRDREGAPQVAIVSESFARHFFGDRPAIGKRFGFDSESSSRDMEIAGIAPDIKQTDLWGEAPRVVYRPAAQVPDFLESIEVRTPGDPAALAPEVRRAIAEVSPDLPVTDVSPLSARLDVALRQEMMLSRLTMVFGLLALMLASIGLHGVLAYSVSQRTNEIGLRLALGAGRRHVLWMVLKQALIWVGLGAAAGAVATLALGRLMASLLFNLDPFDPMTVVTAALTLAAVSVVAAWWPALRAARLDPLPALRCE